MARERANRRDQKSKKLTTDRLRILIGKQPKPGIVGIAEIGKAKTLPLINTDDTDWKSPESPSSRGIAVIGEARTSLRMNTNDTDEKIAAQAAS